MRAAVLVMLLLLAGGGRSWAISDPAEALPDPAQEARAVEIGRQLRCLVCQNESIEDSGADLARDLRRLVRQHVAAGESQAQITAWLVSRYGDFVRLRPPMTWGTLLLWLSPLLALVGGGLAILLGRRRATTMATPTPLDPAEREKLERLLRT